VAAFLLQISIQANNLASKKWRLILCIKPQVRNVDNLEPTVWLTTFLFGLMSAGRSWVWHQGSVFCKDNGISTRLSRLVGWKGWHRFNVSPIRLLRASALGGLKHRFELF
jgi:hypothetical protein